MLFPENRQYGSNGFSTRFPFVFTPLFLWYTIVSINRRNLFDCWLRGSLFVDATCAFISNVMPFNCSFFVLFCVGFDLFDLEQTFISGFKDIKHLLSFRKIVQVRNFSPASIARIYVFATLTHIIFNNDRNNICCILLHFRLIRSWQNFKLTPWRRWIYFARNSWNRCWWKRTQPLPRSRKSRKAMTTMRMTMTTSPCIRIEFNCIFKKEQMNDLICSAFFPTSNDKCTRKIIFKSLWNFNKITFWMEENRNKVPWKHKSLKVFSSFVRI